MPPDAAAARDRLLADHRDVLRAVLDAADAVSRAWDGDATADRDRVVSPLRHELERRGVLECLPRLVADAAEASGIGLAATPVPAPPYVAVTSTGPVLRATGREGRLVISIRAFAVERGDPTRYRRLSVSPGEALAVEVRYTVGRNDR